MEFLKQSKIMVINVVNLFNNKGFVVGSENIEVVYLIKEDLFNAQFNYKRIIFKIYSLAPIIILFISVLNEFDFNYLNLDYFSFNFPFILIFFFSLKDFKHFDYFLVFIAGLINDTVVGLPLGISSLSYMIICISTSYLKI